MKKPLLTGYWFRDLQSLIMASISLLLLVSFLCITIHGCFGSYTPTVNTTFSPTAPRLPCEYVAIGKCNHEFKNVFLIANRRAIYAGRTQRLKDKKNVYCQALQVLIKLYWVSTLFNTVVKFSPSFFFEQFFPISRHGKVKRLPWVFMGDSIFQTVYHALWLPPSHFGQKRSKIALQWNFGDPWWYSSSSILGIIKSELWRKTLTFIFEGIALEFCV